MEVTITWQTIITAAAVIGALSAIFKYYNRGYDFVKRQEKQDEIIKEIQSEQALLTYGVLACLKGLHEQGANGPVTEAINKFEKHLNEKAHETK
jgi:Na+/H+ antiporter NhaD/arsenite permease-like protein